jgi:hypothetical protein
VRVGGEGDWVEFGFVFVFGFGFGLALGLGYRSMDVSLLSEFASILSQIRVRVRVRVRVRDPRCVVFVFWRRLACCLYSFVMKEG